MKVPILKVMLLLSLSAALIYWIPSRVPRALIEDVSVEPRFAANWETNDSGAFVWVLQPEVQLVVANNREIHKTSRLRMKIGRTPCGLEGRAILEVSPGLSRRIHLSQVPTDLEFRIHLKPFERRVVQIQFLNSPCQLTPTDERVSYGLLGYPEVNL